MSLWNPFKREPLPTPAEPLPSAAPRIHTVEAKPRPRNVKRDTGGRLRAGMWVAVGTDRIGVLKSMNEFGVCAVMLVDGAGFDLMELQVPVAEVSQARLSQIPAARVAHLPRSVLQSAGYKD